MEQFEAKEEEEVLVSRFRVVRLLWSQGLFTHIVCVSEK